jgi:diguanylate cyclase (GGDEF)-like protein
VKPASTTASVARRLLPYGATTLLAFVLVAIDHQRRPGELVAGGVLACLVFGLVAMPARTPFPRAVRVVPIALFLVAVFLLRDSIGGNTSGVGILALLPICWLALYARRADLVAGLIGVAAFWALPVLLIGGDGYPANQLRTAATYVAVAGLIGLTVQALVGALAAQAENVARVARVARAISVAPDARHEICAAACDVSGASFAMLFEPTGEGHLWSTAMAGIAIEPVVIGLEDETSAARLAFVRRQPVFAADAANHPVLNRRVWEAQGRPASMLFEPVHQGDATVGVLVVGWPQRVSDARTGGPALIALLAAEAAAAIANADLVDKLSLLADTDSLTGLPNRRTWKRELNAAIQSSPAQDLCVAMIDLDNFKDFNDAHGHLAGDRQLKESAAAWQRRLRSGDVLARLGGEEFAVVMRDCALSDAAAIVERLRHATPSEQTCSAGVVARRPGEGPDELMARADGALYAAKRAGRDQLVALDA